MSLRHKNKWQDKANVVVTDTKTALQLVYDNLNHGQQKKLMKNEQVKALLERYGVLTDSMM